MVLVMCVLTAVVWLVIIIFLVWLCAGGTGVSVLAACVCTSYLMDTSSGHGVYVRAILILILFVAIL